MFSIGIISIFFTFDFSSSGILCISSANFPAKCVPKQGVFFGFEGTGRKIVMLQLLMLESDFSSSFQIQLRLQYVSRRCSEMS